MLGKYSFEKLDDLAVTSFIGVLLPRVQINDAISNDKVETVKVLMPKAIDNGVLYIEEIPEIYVKQGGCQGKTTRRDDVVIKLTTPYDTARITDDEEGLVIPSYCAILRDINKDVADPGYLSSFLNTQYAREILTACVASPTAMITMQDLLSIEVPLPPIEEQRRLGDLYMISCQKRGVLSEMLINEKMVIENMTLSAISEVIENEC